jgi:N5-(cytidine 5'-diphosphoramidyl)-L-glutamine hydrolase
MINRLKIGISQRRMHDVKTLESRDGLDIRLMKLVWNLGFLPIPLTAVTQNNNEYLSMLALDGFILSGGNDLGESPDRDILEHDILTYSTALHKPVLGICRGMQFINKFQDGALHKISGHVATTHTVSGSLFDNSKVQVNSFHNYGILTDELGNDLNAIALADDGVVEALSHSHHRWMGIMWHPERDDDTSVMDKKLIFEHLNGDLQ